MDSKKLALLCRELADNRKAEDIAVLDVRAILAAFRIKRALIWSGVNRGWADRRSTTAPLTVAAAMLVPLRTT